MSSHISPLHPNEFVHWHHRVIQVRHDEHRPEHHETGDEDAEQQCQKIVGLIRRARNVQKEREMHTHLRDCENPKKNRYDRQHDLCGVKEDDPL